MKQKRRSVPNLPETCGRRPAAHKNKKIAVSVRWPCEQCRRFTLIGVPFIVLCTVTIYWQTVLVPPIDYEDPFYLTNSPYVHVTPAFSRLGAVWNEPYFANFHPVTTMTWLIDRALADKGKPFDGLPFRVTQLLYAVIGASLLIPMYRRLGIPAVLGGLGASVYAVHPIHTEVVAWLSARKDLISLIFILLGCLAWLHAREATTPNHWRLWHALTILITLLAVLSKPVAVIVPALFIAYEFCSGKHEGILDWRWTRRNYHPILTRTLALGAIFLVMGGASATCFRYMLATDPTHGGWLIFVPVGLLFVMLAMAPAKTELRAFCAGEVAGAPGLAGVARPGRAASKFSCH